MAAFGTGRGWAWGCLLGSTCDRISCHFTLVTIGRDCKIIMEAEERARKETPVTRSVTANHICDDDGGGGGAGRCGKICGVKDLVREECLDESPLRRQVPRQR